MIVIEAVRTACWNAITGRRQVVTVDSCADELRQGDSSMAGYVPVSEEQPRTQRRFKGIRANYFARASPVGSTINKSAGIPKSARSASTCRMDKARWPLKN